MSVSNLKVVMVQKVLLDACGWAAVIDSGMNIDTEIGRVFGPAQLVLLDSVKEEIEQLNLQRPRNKNLLLPLLAKKTEPIEALDADSLHPDDQLVTLATEFRIPVLTVDVNLKRRLYELGIPILEVTQNQRLQLVDSL